MYNKYLFTSRKEETKFSKRTVILIKGEQIIRDPIQKFGNPRCLNRDPDIRNTDPIDLCNKNFEPDIRIRYNVLYNTYFNLKQI